MPKKQANSPISSPKFLKFLKHPKYFQNYLIKTVIFSQIFKVNVRIIKVLVGNVYRAPGKKRDFVLEYAPMPTANQNWSHDLTWTNQSTGSFVIAL